MAETIITVLLSPAVTSPFTQIKHNPYWSVLLASLNYKLCSSFQGSVGGGGGERKSKYSQVLFHIGINYNCCHSNSNFIGTTRTTIVFCTGHKIS